jgi:hypothetical protein
VVCKRNGWREDGRRGERRRRMEERFIGGEMEEKWRGWRTTGGGKCVRHGGAGTGWSLSFRFVSCAAVEPVWRFAHFARDRTPLPSSDHPAIVHHCKFKENNLDRSINPLCRSILFLSHSPWMHMTQKAPLWFFWFAPTRLCHPNSNRRPKRLHRPQTPTEAILWPPNAQIAKIQNFNCRCRPPRC